ncbi:MAG: Uma2 family endonuclease, partial [Chloroflexota bacterium]
AGVPLVWLADPERRSVTVWTPDEAPRTLHPGDTLDGGAVLPGLALPVAAVFAGIGGDRDRG